MAVRMVLDTDIGSDVDDALALAFALRHPEIELVAVTTVADDAVRRAQIATKLLRIAGRPDIEVAPGVGWDRPPADRKSWFGHEGKGLLDEADAHVTYDRDAVSVLLEETQIPGTEVAVVGMQSNIAAAVERDQTFADRVSRLDVMGGVFAPVRAGDRVLSPATDHNLMVDPQSSIRALNAGFNTLYVPLDVTVRAPLSRAHLEELRRGDEICRALAALIDVWIPISGMPEGIAAILHDPLTVACVVDRRCVTSETMPVTVAVHDGAVRTFVDPADGKRAEVITSVDGEAFADLWLRTVLG